MLPSTWSVVTHLFAMVEIKEPTLHNVVCLHRSKAEI